MEIFSVILAILFLTRIFAEVAERLGQPSLVGEMAAGITMGVLIQQYGSSVGITLDFAEERKFTIITDLGIFFLMLLAGLELRPREMSEASKLAFGIASGGLLLPLTLGCGLGYMVLPESDYKLPQILFIGTALAITAVPVAVRVLLDLKKLNSQMGRSIVSAAVIDDVLSLILLALLTGMIKSGMLPSLSSFAILVVKIIIFFGICWLLGKYLFPMIARILPKGKVPEGELGGLLIGAFAFALLAELLSLHFIIGAFLAGLLFQKKDAGHDLFEHLQKRVSGITSGFLAPIFFASIGLHVTFDALIETPLFTLSLLTLAIVGKVVGAGLPALAQYKDIRQAAIIGTAMNGRGAVELIILEIALRANLFSHPSPTPAIVENIFSAIVIMAVVTTIMTPLILKKLLQDSP
jgi:Kef-type K+ transport system membrane component KefB